MKLFYHLVATSFFLLYIYVYLNLILAIIDTLFEIRKAFKSTSANYDIKLLCLFQLFILYISIYYLISSK